MTTENHTEIVSMLRSGFNDGLLKDVGARKSVIQSLRRMIEEKEEELANASLKDLPRPRIVPISMYNIMIKREASIMLKYMDDWIRDEPVPRDLITFMDTSYIQRQPLGVVLIIGSWNYPLFTLLHPLIGAIAAGNTVLLKPSEYSPQLGQLLKNLIATYVDKKICQVICGDVDVCQKLLETERFDHIMYTGGTNGGKAVYLAAAKFLTPVTLELGGKCPAYVDSDADVELAARRIMMWKTYNCGQTCIAPDYVLCHQEVLNSLLEKIGKCIETFFGKDVRASPDLGRIINERHWKRLMNLMSGSKGKVLYGGETDSDDLYIAPTVVINVDPDDSLMSEELFGPILPVITVNSPEHAVDIVRAKERPLAVYVFTRSQNVFSMFKSNTTSGALVQNDCASQVLSTELPFGGVGQSGFGRYHGKHSINTFSNHRGVMIKSTSEFINQRVLYPPYNDEKMNWTKWFASTSDWKMCSIM